MPGPQRPAEHGPVPVRASAPGPRHGVGGEAVTAGPGQEHGVRSARPARASPALRDREPRDGADRVDLVGERRVAGRAAGGGPARRPRPDERGRRTSKPSRCGVVRASTRAHARATTGTPCSRASRHTSTDRSTTTSRGRVRDRSSADSAAIRARRPASSQRRPVQAAAGGQVRVGVPTRRRRRAAAGPRGRASRAGRGSDDRPVTGRRAGAARPAGRGAGGRCPGGGRSSRSRGAACAPSRSA